MADAWDPFAVDEPVQETEAEDTKSKLSSVVAAKSAAAELTKEDMDYVSKAVISRMRLQKPWEVPLDVDPDTDWSPIACSVSDWRHKDVLLEEGNGIAMVIFNRPNENNSMQDTLGFGINDAVLSLHDRPDLRVAIFTGEGRMYCAGGDPKAWQANAARLRGEVIEGDGTVANRCVAEPVVTQKVIENSMGLQARAYHADVHRFGHVSLGQMHAAKQWNTWYTIPQFSICLVNGSAMGGGVGCVCCCDYVIAVKRAYLVLSEVKIGVVPATISPYVIAKIGTSNAKRFFCAAENLSAERAKQYGIVDEVVENMKEGHARIQEIVKQIEKLGPRAISDYKQLVSGTNGVPLGKALRHYTCRLQSMASDRQEAKEGLAAKAAGKPPPWCATKIGFEKWPMVGVGGQNK